MEPLKTAWPGDRLLAFLLVGTMASWGANMSLVKLLAGYAEPVMIAAVRMALAAVFLFVISQCAGAKWPKPSGVDAMVLFACGLAMVYVYQIALCEGVYRSTATNSSLIVALIPIATYGISILWGDERPGRLQLSGILLGLLGVAIVVLHRPEASLALQMAGDALLLVAVLGFSVGGVLVQRVAARYDALYIATITHAVGAVFLIVHAVASDSMHGVAVMADFLPAMLVVISALVPAAIGNAIWYKSISRLGAARVAPALYLVPVFGLLVAILALGEPFSLVQVVALVAILIGTYCATRRATPQT